LKALCDDSGGDPAGDPLLMSESDLAMTFLDVAETSESKETRHRNHGNARTAYDSILRLMENAMPDAAQRGELNTKLALLKERLQAGPSVYPRGACKSLGSKGGHRAPAWWTFLLRFALQPSFPYH
jgi:hypothetical protein